jgi:hypothetical protein
MSATSPRDWPEIKDPKKRGFLAAYAKTGIIERAAKAAQVPSRTHRQWLTDEGIEGDIYRAAFEDAHYLASDLMEKEARHRAVHGLRKYKFHNGEPIIDPRTGEQYYEDDRSDLLLIFMLKAAMPEKYRERTEVDIRSEGFTKPIGEVVKECIEFLKERTPLPAENNNGNSIGSQYQLIDASKGRE